MPNTFKKLALQTITSDTAYFVEKVEQRIHDLKNTFCEPLFKLKNWMRSCWIFWNPKLLKQLLPQQNSLDVPRIACLERSRCFLWPLTPWFRCRSWFVFVSTTFLWRCCSSSSTTSKETLCEHCLELGVPSLARKVVFMEGVSDIEGQKDSRLLGLLRSSIW